MKVSKSVFGSLLGATIVAIIASPAFAQGKNGGHYGHGDSGFGNPNGIFERMDTNKDGVITKAEVKAANDALFREIDTNNDGFLSKEELKAHRERQEKIMRDKMQERMENRKLPFDKNNDGSITQSEWNQIQKQKVDEKQKRHEEMFKNLDKNGDGKITKEEFDGKFTNKTVKTEKVEIKQRLDLDTNKDGKISKAEWDAKPFPLFDIADTNKDGKITKEEAAKAMRPPKPPKAGGPMPPPPPPM